MSCGVAGATASAFGVSMLLRHSATAFHLVTLAGAGYLGWLSLYSLHRALCTLPAPIHLEVVAPSRSRAPKQCLLGGFLSNVLNPKAAVFYLAFLLLDKNGNVCTAFQEPMLLESW